MKTLFQFHFQLISQMRLYIKSLKGKVTTLNYCYPNDTVLEIKQKIQLKEGIPVEQQRLIFKFKTLEDNRQLKDYNITNDATLHIISRPKNTNNLYIKTLMGKVVTIPYNVNKGIYAIKSEIANEVGYSASSHRLIFAGKTLENGRT